MSNKRISRARKRDLEQPDEFLSVTATLIQRLSRYRTPLAAGVIVLFASLAAFSAVRYFSGQAENRAFQRLSADLKTYQAAVAESTPREALERVKPQFESLLADDGQREGGILARLVYADLNYRAGDHEGAIANYEQAVTLMSPEGFAYGSALSGLGYAYLAVGARDKAIRCFEKIVAGQYPQLRADALFQLGRLFGEQGETAKQTEMFQQLLDEAPTFVYADLIKRKIES
jgi:tetratricopeptide (TPR) repeat protein